MMATELNNRVKELCEKYNAVIYDKSLFACELFKVLNGEKVFIFAARDNNLTIRFVGKCNETDRLFKLYVSNRNNGQET